MTDPVARESLPVADRAFEGTLPFDARDPEARLPADRAAAATGGGAQRARHPARRRGLRRLERVRRAVPHADRRTAGRRRPEVQPLPHHGAVCADPCRAADRPQPPLGGDGRHHRAGHLGTRLQLGPAEHLCAAGADPAAERLLDRPVRQVPRGAGVADQPDGAVRRLAHRRWWLRALLRLHRRRDQPVLPGDLRGHHAGGAGDDARGGLPLHRGHDRQGDRLDPPAEVPDAGQAVLRLLRPGRHPRAAPRARPSGRTSTRAASTPAGTRCARRSSPGRRSSAWCPPTPC